MRSEVMEFYGLVRSPRAVGCYETAHHRQLLQDIKQAICDGDLVALTGVVGAGKTVTLRRLQDMLAKENRVIVSKSVAIEKQRVTLGTLITALFCDLTIDKEPKIPKQGELRERELRSLVRKRRRPIVLVIDDAQDLHHSRPASSASSRWWLTATASCRCCSPDIPSCAMTCGTLQSIWVCGLRSVAINVGTPRR
jgi:type II secretory pathway predicted ATPase ExeA